jgi:hypothetical protein
LKTTFVKCIYTPARICKSHPHLIASPMRAPPGEN